MSLSALYSHLPAFAPKLCTQNLRGLISVKAKPNHHSRRSQPVQVDDFDYFPEAVLLRKRGIWTKGKPLPDYAEEEEDKLVQTLQLQLETGVKIQRIRHYEVIYLIHEDHAHEVDSVKKRLEGFLKEKKATVWRINDWGMRRLCYKIKRASNAYYVLMNFEVAARYIDEFEEFLKGDSRVIRYLLQRMDEAVTEYCPPPPEFHTMRAKVQGMEDGVDPDCIAQEADEPVGDCFDEYTRRFGRKMEHNDSQDDGKKSDCADGEDGKNEKDKDEVEEEDDDDGSAAADDDGVFHGNYDGTEKEDIRRAAYC